MGESSKEGSPASFLERLNREWNSLKSVLQGGRSSLSSDSPEARRRRKLKAQSEILSEMHKVVLKAPLKDRKKYAGLLGALEEGASLEGIYRGFVSTPEYRELEKRGPRASGDVFERFVTLLMDAQLSLPEARILMPQDGDPPKRLGYQHLVNPKRGTNEGTLLKAHLELYRKALKSARSGNAQKLDALYREIFSRSSIYTLKRILSDEVLRLMDSMKNHPIRMAEWYSNFAVTSTAYQIDFALEPRNSAEADMHRKWALKAEYEQVVWEVLNRIHRLLENEKT